MTKMDMIINRIKEKYVLLVHYRNPYLYKAGSENYIITQINEFEKQDISAVVIFPVIKKFGKIKIQVWGIVFEKKFMQMCSVEELEIYIYQLNIDKLCVGVFIHSIINTDLKELERIIRFRKNVCIYIHDYCTCCVQYNLLKNDMEYCGSALLEQNKCCDCKYFADAIRQKKEIEEFFEKIEDLVVIVPSEFVKQLWQSAYPRFKKKVIVIEHQLLEGVYLGNNDHIAADEPIRVAFVGNGLKIKGWDKWLNVVDQLHDQDCRIQFYHFGYAPVDRKYITRVPVSILEDGPDAMIKALRKYSIHVTLLFSCCPETYSYTYYESMAANTFVITSDISGNIACEVRKYKNGIIIENTMPALKEILGDYIQLRNKINQYRLDQAYAPKELINNTKYLSLLKEEKKYITKIDKKNKHKCKKKMIVRISEVLYRVRYKI